MVGPVNLPALKNEPWLLKPLFSYNGCGNAGEVGDPLSPDPKPPGPGLPGGGVLGPGGGRVDLSAGNFLLIGSCFLVSYFFLYFNPIYPTAILPAKIT